MRGISLHFHEKIIGKITQAVGSRRGITITHFDIFRCPIRTQHVIIEWRPSRLGVDRDFTSHHLLFGIAIGQGEGQVIQSRSAEGQLYARRSGIGQSRSWRNSPRKGQGRSFRIKTPRGIHFKGIIHREIKGTRIGIQHRHGQSIARFIHREILRSHNHTIGINRLHGENIGSLEELNSTQGPGRLGLKFPLQTRLAHNMNCESRHRAGSVQGNGIGRRRGAAAIPSRDVEGLGKITRSNLGLCPGNPGGVKVIVGRLVNAERIRGILLRQHPRRQSR